MLQTISMETKSMNKPEYILKRESLKICIKNLELRNVTNGMEYLKMENDIINLRRKLRELSKKWGESLNEQA